MARRTRDLPTRMGAATAQVQALDRRPVVGPPCKGPLVKELLRDRIQLPDVAVRQPHPPFYVQRSHQLPLLHQVSHTGCVDGQGIHQDVEHLLVNIVPTPLGQLDRLDLHPGGHHVVSFGGQGIVVDGGYLNVHLGAVGKAAVPGVCHIPLEVLHGRAYLDHGQHFGVEALSQVSAEIRKTAESTVELQAGELGLEALHPAQEVVVQMLRIDQVQEGALGVGVGDHDGRAYLLPAYQHHTYGPSPFDHDLIDLGVRPNRCALALGGPGHSLGYHSHAALDQAHVHGVGEPVDVKVGPGQDRAGHTGVAGLCRADKRPLHLLRLEVVLDQVFHSPGQHGLQDLFVGGPPGLLEELSQPRWGAQDVGLDEARGPLPEPVPAGKRLGVSGRDPGDVFDEPVCVAPQVDIASIGKGEEPDRVQGVHIEAVLPKLQVFYHLVLQHVAVVGAGGEFVAGDQLLGGACPSDDLPALQHHDPKTGPGQIRCAGQAVVPATYYDDIVVLRHVSPPGEFRSVGARPLSPWPLQTRGYLFTDLGP